MTSHSEVFRIVEDDPDSVWASRPYRTVGAARAEASKMNNDELRWATKFREPKKYKVQRAVTEWEDV